jgi:hypothetical protein
MLSRAHRDFSARLAEVRRFHALIATIESPEPRGPDTDDAHILRGLFYVHLYGVLEFSVNQIVQETLTLISFMNVKTSHLEPAFYSIALDPRFAAIRDAPGDAKWRKRIELLQQQTSEQACSINDLILAVSSKYLDRHA